MSKKNDFSFDDEQDFRKIQKTNNKRIKKSNRHKNRQNLNDITEKLNRGYNLESIEDEYEGIDNE